MEKLDNPVRPFPRFVLRRLDLYDQLLRHVALTIPRMLWLRLALQSDALEMMER
jgi:hypothetical protein